MFKLLSVLAVLAVSAFAAPADHEVSVYLCTDDLCTSYQVPPNECTSITNPGYVTSIQNTAACVLYGGPNCQGDSRYVKRGSSGDLDFYARSFKCFEN